VAVVVGSGITAQTLSTDVGLQLLENALATAAGLAVLILILGPICGAHFNPMVSIADWALGRRGGNGLAGSEVLGYGAAYFFTSSTSFANPAVAVGLAGLGAGLALILLLYPTTGNLTGDAVVLNCQPATFRPAGS
jgi:Major intrinsic protein